jgi:DNA-binding transcriptional LysR family regulator
MPGSVLRFSAERFALRALPIRLPPVDDPIAVVTLKNRTLSPVAQLFVECAREVARPIAKSLAS